MVILKKNEHLIMPSGLTATYDATEEHWSFDRPTIWKDLKDILSNSPKRYIEISVGQRVVVSDGSVWYCSSKNDLVEAVCHEYA